jgi:hypothetical protein
MYLLFLDESGRLDQGTSFALGGIAIRDADWPVLRDLWQSALHDAGWPADRELKWHGIRTGEVPPALADAIYAALSRAPITCFVCVLDLELGKQTEPDFFRTAEDAYATALMFLAERFQHRLQAEDDLGLIVVDSRHREEDSRRRRFFADLQADGTPYMKLSRIVEGLFLGPSHYSIGLQCADLVVAVTAAAERGIGQGSGYLRILEPRFPPPLDRPHRRRRTEALSRTRTKTTRAPQALLKVGRSVSQTHGRRRRLLRCTTVSWPISAISRRFRLNSLRGDRGASTSGWALRLETAAAEADGRERRRTAPDVLGKDGEGLLAEVNAEITDALQ